MSPIRILIVDDHPLFRGGVRSVCEGEPSLELVGEAVNGLEAVELARALRPDVILMDADMPLLGGIAATRLIVAENPDARVIILTVYQHGEEGCAAIEAGARGCLPRSIDAQPLIEAVHVVYEGNLVLAAHLTPLLQEMLHHTEHSESKQQSLERQLTARELTVLRLVSAGKDDKTIAQQLSISERTVSNYIHAIYEKLHIHNRVQATLYALRYGLVSLDPVE